MIRVLVADDSSFMRKVLSDLFTEAPDFEVVGTAATGKEAVTQVLKLKPDVVTMDVNMPVMDGLKAVEAIMTDCPTPIMMFSSLTKEDADETVKALSLGAVDFMCKAGGSISKIDSIAGEILEKCRNASKANVKKFGINNNILEKKQEAGNLKRINILEKKDYNLSGNNSSTATSAASRLRGLRLTAEPVPPVSAKLKSHSSAADRIAKRENPYLKMRAANSGRSGNKLVVLGTSTGGPKALQAVVPKLPADMPCGMVIVQHMPAGFTKSLAERLDYSSQVTVKEAEDNDPILPGYVYIAPGNYHLEITGSGPQRVISLNQKPPVGSHRPAVDPTFESVVQYGSDVVSVILTGMGCDGSAGMKKIKEAGGYVIAESKESCVVYGMPKAVVDAGIADEVLPVEQVADAIVNAVRK
ncbi:MAG: chemotaxis response regulator protein-glutamate methylesterase [Anaerovibrio sp.]|uniref:protein-glutamate methylesterase/protein-glutamine glutaminase n=1 Tax=Anaerovibrio sp. TaxID=1872532 RepID=UPI0025BC226D|nr:chemotaxis response regulator protein-glutamate methylesterase [Anaerovibrio sp.]MBE6099032.1 chemotaxis response regulator protein-glutamate methylesterase [Anaerovibrio sp.]